MNATDAASCKDADPCEAGNKNSCRNRGDTCALCGNRNGQIAFSELLFGGEDQRLLALFDSGPEFAVNHGGYCRNSAGRSNRCVHAIKAFAVVGGGEAHLRGDRGFKGDNRLTRSERGGYLCRMTDLHEPSCFAPCDACRCK